MPEGSAVAGGPPRRPGQTWHVQRAQDRGGANPEPKQETNTHSDLAETDQNPKKNGMGKNDGRKESFVEADGLAWHEGGDVLLNPAVNEGVGKELVLSKEDKNDGRQ